MSAITTDPADMRDVEYQITLTLRAPVLSRSVSAAAYGLDAPAARDHRNRLYLAGTLVKGCLREALDEIKSELDLDDADLNRWFGLPSAPGTYDTAARGSLEFSDFVTTAREDNGLGFRIRIDADRGAVARGALLTMEMPFKPGREIAFCGAVRGVLSGKETAAVAGMLAKGLRWMPALGGQRGVGFGRLIGVKVSIGYQKPPPSPPVANATDDDSVLLLALRPQAPFCLSRHTPVRNLFDSAHVISGAVIKGTLANTLNRLLGRSPDAELRHLPPPWKELGEQFHNIRIKHAFPVYRSAEDFGFDRRPCIPPLSTVLIDKHHYDIALKCGAGLINGRAPAFSADWKWKERQTVWERFGWPTAIEDEKEMRVRTGMDAASRRARNNALFAVKQIIPDRFEWISAADFEAVKTDRAAVRSQLTALLNFGLIGFSRSKVRVSVGLKWVAPETGIQSCLSLEYDDRSVATSVYVVTLQTPALIFEYEKIAGLQNDPDLKLKEAYAAYWQNISDDTLVLKHFYARQVLKGRYLFYHFANAEMPYNPILLTESGSVFVLAAASGKAVQGEQKMAQLARAGLPLPDWAESGDNRQRRWVWTPANGFGEIKVNHDWHLNESPKQNEWEGLTDECCNNV